MGVVHESIKVLSLLISNPATDVVLGTVSRCPDILEIYICRNDTNTLVTE